MKAGKTLEQLAQSLEHARKDARDFIVPASQLIAFPGTAANENAKVISIGWRGKEGGENTFNLNNWSSTQLASYADVPKAYFDRIILENPGLAAQNVNHGLEKAAGDKRMVRSLDGTIRALLSPKYRRLDSADLVDAILPSLFDAGMQVVSSELTDRRLYLRATTTRLTGEIAKGDVVQAGIMISNSDVGAGALRVEPFLLRLVCLNGMVREHAIKKAHIGRNLALGDGVEELLTEKTVRLGEAAFWAEVKDVVAGLLRPEIFERDVEKLREAAAVKITNFDLAEVVEMTCASIGLKTTEQTKLSIVEALAAGNQGAGLTKWGLANSFTAAAAAEHLDFDQAVELERAGSQVIDLDAKSWRLVGERRA